MSLQETTAFFEGYRCAFTQLDGAAVAALWQAPAGIADSHGPAGSARFTHYADAAALRANMVALCEVYRGNGFSAAEFSVIEHADLGANHSFANVHWTLRRADGSTLQSFRTAYQLARGPERVQAQMCVAYEEDLAAWRPHAPE